MLQFTAIGNIGGNAELREENGNKFVTFKVAHNERYTRQDGTSVDTTIWVSCVLNGDGGGLLQYLVKGQLVYVCGEGNVRTYHSKTAGRLVAGIDIRVRQIQLLGSKADDVPKVLFTEDGAAVTVNKFYNAAGQSKKLLIDKNGEAYTADENGWITKNSPSVTSTQQEQTQQTADEPF